MCFNGKPLIHLLVVGVSKSHPPWHCILAEDVTSTHDDNDDKQLFMFDSMGPTPMSKNKFTDKFHSLPYMLFLLYLMRRSRANCVDFRFLVSCTSQNPEHVAKVELVQEAMESFRSAMCISKEQPIVKLVNSIDDESSSKMATKIENKISSLPLTDLVYDGIIDKSTRKDVYECVARVECKLRVREKTAKFNACQNLYHYLHKLRNDKKLSVLEIQKAQRRKLISEFREKTIGKREFLIALSHTEGDDEPDKSDFEAALAGIS